MVLLVVAADDGVMPQTREHLDIMQLVGAREGVVAVTKIDLDRELAELAAEEVRAFLEGTFLKDAPVVPVSSVTGEGLDDLWAALAERVARAGPKSSDGLFRMPVQRVFVREGFGAILTGVPVSGTARPGDVVDVLPGGGRGRIRGVQAYFRDVELARAGHSTGLNVADMDTSACRRGQVVVPADTYEPSALVDARLHLLPAVRYGGVVDAARPGPRRCPDDAAKKPLATGAEVRLHTGTAEVAAKVVVLDRETIEPGGEALVQLRLEEPVVFDRLDRFVIRRPSPALTIGGGTIIGPGRRRLRGGRPWIAERVRGRELASRSDESFAEHLVETASGGSIRADVLRRATLLPAERTGEIVKGLEAARRLRSFPPGPSYTHARTIQRLLGRLSGTLAELHRHEPDLPGLDVKRAAVDLGVAPPLIELVVAEGVEAGRLARDGGCLRLASHTPSLGDVDAELAGKVESIVREAGYTPPPPAEVARRLAASARLSSPQASGQRSRPNVCDLAGDRAASSGQRSRPDRGAKEQRVARVCDFLAHAGILVRVAPGMFFHAEHVGNARDFILRELGEKGAVETQAVKAFMVSAGGTSRKYLVPLLEHFDRTGLTRREGDLRRAGDGARLEPKRGK